MRKTTECLCRSPAIEQDTELLRRDLPWLCFIPCPRQAPPDDGDCSWMEMRDTGEGKVKKKNIPTRPGTQNQHEEEETKWAWTGERPSGALKRALSWEGGGCVTLGESPLLGLSFLFYKWVW